MAKKIHMLKAGSLKMSKHGEGLCGIKPQSKGKGTIINTQVTCSICLHKMGIDPMDAWRSRRKKC